MDMNSHSLIAAIKELVGDANVMDAPSDMEPYLIDWRKRHSGKAACVVFPRTTEQVSKVLAFCNENAVKVFPQGGNTSVCGGSVPDHDGQSVLLNMRKMNRIIDLNPRNNSMAVEAGCVLADIQAAALEVDRLFPLTLGAEGSCQIGGNIATNAGGTNVLRFGNTRDLILGIEVVLADGRIWNGLRSLRKNNSGYDLKNLFVGSEGTLGVVTAATLKLFPRPHAIATAMLGVETVSAAVDEGLKLQAAFPGELVGLYSLAILTNLTATLWAAGVAMRVRSIQGGPLMQFPVFLILFLAPVYVPLSLLSGWIHAVASVNPVTALLEAGRGFISGEPVVVALAFALAVTLPFLFAFWARRGLRRAETAG